MVIFFVTTSDSTSLVFDTLSSNNDEHHSVLQRIFWSLFQGVTTIVLIAVGSQSALKMAQSICILASIPNMIMIWIACSNMIYSLNRSKREETPETDEKENRKVNGYVRFKIPIYGGFLDIFETMISLGKHDPRRGSSAPPSKAVWWYTFTSLFAPWWTIYKIQIHNDKPLYYKVAMAVFGVMSLRVQCRKKYDIDGNAFEDLFGSLLWFQVLTQVVIEEELASKDKEV
eukprot:Pgem_evm1s5940